MIGGRQSVDQESFMVYVQDDGKIFGSCPMDEPLELVYFWLDVLSKVFYFRTFETV